MTVGIEHAGPVTVLTLDRPEARNAVDAPTATASLHSDPQTHGLRHLGAASTHLPRMRLPQRQGCVARLRKVIPAPMRDISSHAPVAMAEVGLKNSRQAKEE